MSILVITVFTLEKMPHQRSSKVKIIICLVVLAVCTPNTHVSYREGRSIFKYESLMRFIKYQYLKNTIIPNYENDSKIEYLSRLL